MELALNEVKTQAKKLLKALKIDSNLKLSMEIPLKKVGLSLPAEIKLKHCLAIISQQLGFDNWHHAQDILSGTQDGLMDLLMSGSQIINKRKVCC